MEALKQSLKGGGDSAAKTTKTKKRKVAAGQREMLLPISGNNEAKPSAKVAKVATKTRKAG
jgi:hypothetical protein